MLVSLPQWLDFITRRMLIISRRKLLWIISIIFHVVSHNGSRQFTLNELSFSMDVISSAIFRNSTLENASNLLKTSRNICGSVHLKQIRFLHIFDVNVTSWESFQFQVCDQCSLSIWKRKNKTKFIHGLIHLNCHHWIKFRLKCSELTR